MLVLLFAGIWQVLPPSGYVPLLEDPVANLRYLALPVLALAFGEAAYILRTTRGAMEEVLGTPLRPVPPRHGGSAERRIVYRHALRNAAPPIVTVIGIQFGVLLGGAIVIESLFALPGVGRLIVTSIQQRNYTVVQGGRAGGRRAVHRRDPGDRPDRRVARPPDRRGGGVVSVAVAEAGGAPRAIWRRGILAVEEGPVGVRRS